MKANTTSLHARLYRYFYDSDALPDNLCPYFWKLVIAATFIIPLFVLQLPILILDRLYEYHVFADNRKASDGAFLWFISLVLFGYLFCLYHWIRAMFGCYSYNLDAAMVAIIVTSIAAVIGATVSISIWHGNKSDLLRRARWEAIENGREWVEPAPNIIIAYIKAVKGKYCPKIEWK